MSKQQFVLEMIRFVQDDDDDDMFVSRPRRSLWSRRYSSTKRAVKAATRSIKRQLQPGQMIDPEFTLYVIKNGRRREVPLPHVYIKEWSPGVPKLLGGVRYNVGTR